MGYQNGNPTMTDEAGCYRYTHNLFQRRGWGKKLLESSAFTGKSMSKDKKNCA